MGTCIQAGPAITINNATGAGNIITIDDAVADGATKGIAAFNSTNFTAAAGVINTIQDIATTSDVTFNSLGLTDTLNVGGNSTLGDAAGDTLTINGTNVFIPNSLAFDTNVMFIGMAIYSALIVRVL